MFSLLLSENWPFSAAGLALEEILLLYKSALIFCLQANTKGRPKAAFYSNCEIFRNLPYRATT
jgi:hypothetical protein